jgi:hypothetical protein
MRCVKPVTARKFLPLVEGEKRRRMQSGKDGGCLETEIDRELFLTCITHMKESLDGMSRALTHIEQRREDARSDYDCLLPGDDMDRILLYEERMYRQMDWAVQRLLEKQEMWKDLSDLRAAQIYENEPNK